MRKKEIQLKYLIKSNPFRTNNSELYNLNSSKFYEVLNKIENYEDFKKIENEEEFLGRYEEYIDFLREKNKVLFLFLLIIII
jgi:hypothetical protein